jgi:hypothetical protein
MAFNCADTIHLGTLYNAITIFYFRSSITYSGGNGGIYDSQTIA